MSQILALQNGMVIEQVNSPAKFKLIFSAGIETYADQMVVDESIYTLPDDGSMTRPVHLIANKGASYPVYLDFINIGELISFMEFVGDTQ
ncbi:hypothetical protein P8629_02655 [Hydrogenovibrio sp. 3SP14C1]|uniref:hypothetical protein n=1 Tax=Hydrogenovibrio sp. 3SP14C1 TaxID=3038774 RepID=UPI00241709F4|nr:hypothetical protein [Hydrogenovibrio sp. 3SP14C1]MDG4811897.1 hypothetical protein [Hydrogenovibrio sp. 3SP14C1]